MDWIKQIIECKKENWVSPGSLGQKIKKIRMLRKYTQKELGVMCGFSFSSADVRIAQYEKNKKIPREKILKAMCNALGVGEGALVHADMLSYQEMFYALFDMEDFHGLHPVKKEDGYYLRFGNDSIINDFLEEWYKMYQKYPRPRGDDEEEKYTLTVLPNTPPTDGFIFYPPVRGNVTRMFDPAVKHFGGDVSAPKNGAVAAVLDGTVISASFTIETGYVIAVQHSNDFISIYKYNAQLLKSVGEKVVGGENIALGGNGEEEADTPLLEFQLWHKGQPLNPLEYITF